MSPRLQDLSPMGTAYHLEELYRHIEIHRMTDIPILNPKLKVQAIGFRAWNKHVLGLLITPWFMNLMLIPNSEQNWDKHRVGSKHPYCFAAGSFEFIVGEEEDLGKYMSCSMFSPMFEFADQDAAIQTAEAIITGMFNEDNKEVLQSSPLSNEEKNTTESQSMTETMLDGAQTISQIAQENMDKPMSRRELLRGGLFRKKKRQDPVQHG